jgi:hypothetical protein
MLEAAAVCARAVPIARNAIVVAAIKKSFISHQLDSTHARTYH